MTQKKREPGRFYIAFAPKASLKDKPCDYIFNHYCIGFLIPEAWHILAGG